MDARRDPVAGLKQRSEQVEQGRQDESLARRLTDEALIYMYRLLFLLYAEARAAELDVVPVKAEAYMKGYSVEALRDLEQVPLTTPGMDGFPVKQVLGPPLPAVA